MFCQILLLGLFILSAVRAVQPHCKEFFFDVNATAANRIANNPPEDLYTDLDAVNQFLSQPVVYQNVTGRYAIFAQLCAPSRKVGVPKLQVLVHGNTYNHTYWSALQKPNSKLFADRSWIRYATGRGYHTLALDNLGNGLSTHADPAIVVQDPLETEIIHKVVARFRHFPTIVFVGHSWGSGLGVHLAATHPEDVDGLLLTGIAQPRGDPSTGSLYNRWSSLTGHPGYLVSTNKTARQDYFFHGDYDLADQDSNISNIFQRISKSQFLSWLEMKTLSSVATKVCSQQIAQAEMRFRVQKCCFLRFLPTSLDIMHSQCPDTFLGYNVLLLWGLKGRLSG